jgi:hypothetical protein
MRRPSRPSAFSSKLIDADLLLTYTELGFESDVVITRKPKATPADCRMGPNTLLQVRHEWVDAPSPSIWTNIVTTGGEPRANETLDFGDMLFPTGKAFSTPDTEAREPGPPAQIGIAQPGDGAVPVTKEWLDGSPSILIESVPWSAIATNLASLPEMSQVSPAKRGTELALGGNGSAPKPLQGAQRILLAKADRRPAGLVIDYIVVNTGGDYTFLTSGPDDLTYFVDSLVQLSGTVTFEAGCIVKVAPTSGIVLQGQAASVHCQGATGSWSILTSRDDPSFGETTTLPGYTGCPNKGSPPFGLCFTSQSGPYDLSGLRIRWPGLGIWFDDGRGCDAPPHAISDCLFENCGTAVYASGSSVNLGSTPDEPIIRDVDTPSDGTCTVHGSFEVQVPPRQRHRIQDDLPHRVAAAGQEHLH